MIDEFKNIIIGNVYRDNARIVIRRKGDNKSFIESWQTVQKNKRVSNQYTCIDITDEELREIRDYLNTLNL